MNEDVALDGFGRLLRFWRGVFEESQENVAHALDSSPRHISRLENGRVRPSRAMIEKIAAHFGLGDRDTQQLLFAGGFSDPVEPRESHREALRFVYKGVSRALDAFDPNPAMVFDPAGKICMINRSWLGLMHTAFPPSGDLTIRNYFDFIFRSVPADAKPRNWTDTQCGILMVFYQEAVLLDDRGLLTLIEELAERHQLPSDWKRRASQVVTLPSFVVPIPVDDQVVLFTSVSLGVAPSGPAAYLARPSMVLVALLPTRNDYDPAQLQRADLDHPLLHDYFR